MIAPTTPTGSRTSRPKLAAVRRLRRSSKGNVSASAGVVVEGRRGRRSPAYWRALQSTPDSRGQVWPSVGALGVQRAGRARAGSRRARRGSCAATGPRRTPRARRPRRAPCRRPAPRRREKNSSSVPESMTSIVASVDGCTHSPPMKNRSVCAPVRWWCRPKSWDLPRGRVVPGILWLDDRQWLRRRATEGRYCRCRPANSSIGPRPPAGHPQIR